MTKERMEDDLFAAIKENTKVASAVVGLYDVGYKDGWREGRKYGVETVTHDGIMSWLAVVTLAFLTGICVGVYL